VHWRPWSRCGAACWSVPERNQHQSADGDRSIDDGRKNTSNFRAISNRSHQIAQRDNRATQKRGFRRKVDAERWANTVEVQKMTGEYIAPSLGRITVAELAVDWLNRKAQHTAPSHHRMLESAWRVHVEPRWGKTTVADIDHLAVEGWIASMGADSAGATTVVRAHGVLSGILADAVKAKRLSANPAKGVANLPRKMGKRRVYLSADDAHRLADESGQHRALVLVLAYCGLRWGEAIALRVQDVEFLRRRLSVSENAVQLSVNHAVGPTKGRKARSVPVPAFVLNELSVHCQGKDPSGRRGHRLSTVCAGCPSNSA
jgi:integrase